MYNFKKLFTYLVVGALITALYMSCKSNEDPGSGPLEVSEVSGNSKDITITNSVVSTEGTVGFTVNGSTSYTISIESVTMGSGSSLTLVASDFLYTESTKKLTLSDEGLDKVNKASEMKEATAYEYTITFKFVDSSDTSKEKTIDVKVNLYNEKVITKTEIEAMINSMKPVSVNASYGGSGVAKFDFSEKDKDEKYKIVFQKSEPNFTVNEKDKQGGTYKISTARNGMVEEIKKTPNCDTYFSDCSMKSHTLNNLNHTLYIQFTLKGGYALADEVAYITNNGLSIRLTLRSGQTWEAQ